MDEIICHAKSTIVILQLYCNVVLSFDFNQDSPIYTEHINVLLSTYMHILVF